MTHAAAPAAATPTLSVLIPNYNYARYIGETIGSVLAQAPADLEIVVADNASTDDSVAVVRSHGDPRVRLEVNPCNVGFAANLERVAAMARGRRMLLLSSDDRMAPGAVEAYGRLERALGERADRAVWGSASTVIDASGRTTGRIDPDRKLWRGARDEPELSRAVGYPVRSMPAGDMLRRSLELLRSPLPFATTCYSKTLHDAAGGYAGGRLVNPDKYFLWKLLGVADAIYAIDHPLFDYRVHDAGQGPQEQRSGALKHLTDQYVSTFNLPDSVLARAGLDRDALAAAFIEHDIALRGLLAVARGQRITARRGVHFGLATYPRLVRANRKVWALRALLALGPAGTHIARALRDRLEARWQARESQPPHAG
ncbi:MAG TPA: glycosyltransferase family 2 protein [Kofleriaceae bacterium]|nr:glycosyltransferase family 2 protein [Kofleriaceae bacterium]